MALAPGSLLRLPDGLWRLKRRPYFSGISAERSLPWGSKEKVEDSPYHHDVMLHGAGITLISPIAKGSFSTVWKGLWKKYGSLPLALKIYEKKRSRNSSALKSLPTEIAVLRQAKHPHIVSCFGIWETEFRIYLAFELLGGDLLQYLRTHGPASESQAKTWFVQEVSAIKYLHDLRIAHRDIKCENFLLDSNLNIRLADFGFCIMDIPWDASIPNADWRKVRDFCGSEAYFSPEILLRIPYSPLLSDIWAVGVVLYATLFGCFPFDTTKEDLVPHEFPTSWRIPEGRKVTPDCFAVFRRIFLLERRRVRSYELIKLSWFTEPEQLEVVSLSEKAGKTLKDVEEERKMENSSEGAENFWGTHHPHLGKPRTICYES